MDIDKKEQQTENKKPVFMRKTDILLVVVILLIGVILLVLWLTRLTPGSYAEVTILQDLTGEAVVETVDLSKDQIIHLDNTPIPVTLQVEDGRIRFIESVCPDHLCENMGWLENENEEAICLPAGVWVRIVTEQG